jgi:Ca-activated chloride channel family protein
MIVRNWMGVLLTLSWMACGAASLALAQKAATAVPGSEGAVRIYVTVRDEHGREIADLKQEDFRIKEDGAEQTIISFSRGLSGPLTLGLLIDISGSRRAQLPGAEAKPAIDLLGSVLRQGDMGFVGAIGDKPYVTIGLSGDRGELENAIRRTVKVNPHGSTALADTVAWACHTLERAAGRRVLVIVSDGDDNSSHIKLGQAVEMAQRDGVAIWFVDLAIEKSSSHKELKEGKKTAEWLSGETGGEPLFVKNAQDLEPAFIAIGADLRNPYVITYDPTDTARDGRFRTIKIEIPRKHVKVSAPAGYFVRAD